MFNVIRIPTKYNKAVKRLSKNERGELFDNLISISNGEKIKIKDNALGDVLELIYGDWVRMESKNGNKIKESLIYSDCGLLAECESKTVSTNPIINSTEQDSTKQDSIYKGDKSHGDIEKELEKFINYWNEIFLEKRQVTHDLLNSYKSLRKKYTKEELGTGANKYFTDNKETEKRFLLSPIKFFTQKNGLPSYL